MNYYELAAECRDRARMYELKEDTYKNEKSTAEANFSAAKKEKVNFEKRLEDINKVLALLIDIGGPFSFNAPYRIDKANEMSVNAGESYKHCIVSDSVQAADVQTSFETKKIDKCNYSSSAVTYLKNEVKRLEDLIFNLESNMKKLADSISTLEQNIKICQKNAGDYWYSARIYADRAQQP